jgi:hypothetical protein
LFKRLFSKPTPPLTIDMLSINPAGSRDFGPCECCGNFSRIVWGSIHRSQTMVATYFVQWTLNNPEHGANFDLIMGEWDDDESVSETDCQIVALKYLTVNGSTGFAVIDAADRMADKPEFAKVALSRAQVMGTPLAVDAFAMVDAIWLRDPRIAEVQTWSSRA